MQNDLYPSDIEESYLVEKILEICTVDCLFADGGFHTAKDKIAWGVQRSLQIIPRSLKLLDHNCEENIKKHGWAATDKLSMADVMLIHWLSTVIFNPFMVETNSKYLE